jgi:hypothetical protein
MLLSHVTFLFEALDGVKMAVSVSLAPTWSVVETLLSETPVTAIACTVTLHEAVIVLSVVDVAVMVAEPAATPVTFPELSTVATLVLLLDQFTVFPVLASDGV